MDNPENEQLESTITAENLPPRFTKAARIGQGGMGVVFRCYDKTLDREVAVKLLSFEGVLDEKVQQRFLQEAKTLTSLDHFNIVKLYETGLSTDGYPYHVLEFLDGVPLSEELEKNGALKPDRFFQIFSQVCQGLAHAHRKGVIHRDLKPGNIIVCSEKGSKRTIVKIIDFGIARIADEVAEASQSQTTQTLTRTSRLLGSPAYMSPEQCRGAVVDQLSDIYSLGCIMYECLTGKPPFQVRSSMEVMYKHIHEEAPKLEPSAKTPRARQLAAMIDSCLIKDPEFRPTSVDMIIEELANVFQSNIEFEEIKTPSPKAKVPVTKVALLGLIGLALITGSVFAYRSMNKVEVTVKSNLTQDQEKGLKQLQAIEKSVYERLEKASTKELKHELKAELCRVASAIASLQLKAGPKSKADETIDRAMAQCKSDSFEDKIMRATLLASKAGVHGADHDLAEEYFGEAIELVHEATGKSDSVEEENIRRALFKFHLSTRAWIKAKEDFAALRKIWDAAPPDTKDLTEDIKIERCNHYIKSIGVVSILTDPIERKNCVSLGVDMCEYAMQHNNYGVSAPALIQCLHSLHDAPKDNAYYEIAARGYELLSKAETLVSDPSAADHANEAKKLRALIKK